MISNKKVLSPSFRETFSLAERFNPHILSHMEDDDAICARKTRCCCVLSFATLAFFSKLILSTSFFSSFFLISFLYCCWAFSLNVSTQHDASATADTFLYSFFLNFGCCCYCCHHLMYVNVFFNNSHTFSMVKCFSKHTQAFIKPVYYEVKKGWRVLTPNAKHTHAQIYVY